MRIVAKLLEDFAGDWHWVELHNAREVGAENRVYEIDGASTACGIRLSGPRRTRLHDTGAPSEPDCENCLHDDGSGGGLSLATRKDIEEALGVEVVEPILVPVRR
jgi:hypothetical protein